MVMTAESVVAVFRLHGDHKQRALIQRLKQDRQASFAVIQSICLGDYPPSVQRWAVEALGIYDQRVALPLLRRALKSPHMTVRLHGLLGIAALHERSLAHLIRPLLKDESGGIRVNALSIVGAMKPRWWTREAKAALQDSKAYVRQVARRLLASVA